MLSVIIVVVFVSIQKLVRQVFFFDEITSFFSFFRHQYTFIKREESSKN